MSGPESEHMLEEMAAKLGEHFDAVQIMVCWNQDGQSLCTKRGTGLWYARQGMAHEFINADIAQEHAVAIAARKGDDDEDTETM